MDMGYNASVNILRKGLVHLTGVGSEQPELMPVERALAGLPQKRKNNDGVYGMPGRLWFAKMLELGRKFLLRFSTTLLDIEKVVEN